MEPTLKILILEDSKIDAEIIQRLLLKQDMPCEFKLVMSKANYLTALEEFSPDVILSDNSLPGFNATDALKITRQLYLHIPFILVTGAVSEEYAANVIKLGADDYILKDRLARLPAAIEAALKQRKALKELTDYKYALDESAIVSITDQKDIIQYANDYFCKISKYSREELIGQSHSIINSGYHPASFIKDLWQTIANGKIWRNEFKNKAKDGSFYWVDCTIIPFLGMDGKPYQYLSIRKDITERKEAEERLKFLEKKMLEQKVQEQKKIARAIMQGQEKEKNHIGRELHDNINQILAGTKLYLGIAGKKSKAVNAAVEYPIELIERSIQEIRLLCSRMVSPVKNVDLQELVHDLLAKLDSTGTTKSAFTFSITNNDISDELKLNIYRIIQEHINNILKYAQAKNVSISITKKANILTIIVSDDGKGFDVEKKRNGIGISNIINRVETFNGEIEIKSSPGNGCRTEISMPCQ